MLKKLMKKLKHSFICGGEFDDKMSDIMREKISKEEKIHKLIMATANYLHNDIHKEVKLVVWESYYEEFMENDKKDESKCGRFMHYEYGNHWMMAVSRLSKDVDQLAPENPDKLCEMLVNFNKDSNGFDPNQFYLARSDYRKQQLAKVDDVLREIFAYNKRHTSVKPKNINAQQTASL